MEKEVDQPGKEEGSEQGLKLDLCFFFVTYMHTYIIIYKETEIRLAKYIYNTHTHMRIMIGLIIFTSDCAGGGQG